MMLLIALILFVTAELILGLLVYSKNRTSRVHLYFLGFSLAVIVWTVSNYLSDALFSFFWTKMTYVGSTGIAFFLVLFAERFGDRIPTTKWTTVFISLFSGLILALIWIPKIFLVSVQRYDQGVNLVTGPLYIAYPLFFLAAATIALWLLILKYKRALDATKAQIRFLLAGITMSLLIGVLANSIIPLLTSNYQVTKYGPFGAFFFIALTAYAIVRHRLLDVRIALRKAFLQVAVSVTILVFTLVVVFALAPFFDQSIEDFTLVIIGGLALFVGLLFLNPLNQLFVRIANRYFFTSLYNYQTTLEDLARQLTTVINLRKVIDLIVSSIMQTMGLERAGVLLLSDERNSKRYNIAKVVGFNEQNGISLVRNSFLIQWLEQNRKLVVLEDLEWLIEEAVGKDQRSQLMRLKSNMTKIEASICLPLFSKDELIGIIVLGSKVTGEGYTSEDLRLLQAIANQASIAIENARSYATIQEFNKTLAQRVEKQTGEIREKNERLQELLKMKSEFLSIASHQLRTPLTAIRGLLSMQADGDFDSYPQEKVREQQKHMLESANRLSNIVNDLLDAMELEGGNLRFQFKSVQLEDMIKEICTDLQPNYERKGLYLNVEKSKKPIPQVEIEPKMFHEALENLIDNAEKYTNKGGTTVTLSGDRGGATIVVRDTGIGIPKSDFPKLFHKFSRGEKSSYQHTDGSGLGLFIAKNVVTEHHGKIEVTSPGEGKGTTVTITIPLKQPKAQGKM